MHAGLVMPLAAAAEDVASDAEHTVELRAEAQRLGIRSLWFPQLASYEAISLAALVGRAATGLTVGTSVVPMFPRHLQLMAPSAKRPRRQPTVGPSSGSVSVRRPCREWSTGSSFRP